MNGSMGLYESLDYTRERTRRGRRGVIVYAYMAHHQGMCLLSMDNVLNGHIMQRRFHSDPRIQSVESLLYEGIPTERSLLRRTAPEAASHSGAIRAGDQPADLAGRLSCAQRQSSWQRALHADGHQRRIRVQPLASIRSDRLVCRYDAGSDGYLFLHSGSPIRGIMVCHSSTAGWEHGNIHLQFLRRQGRVRPAGQRRGNGNLHLRFFRGRCGGATSHFHQPWAADPRP